MRIKSAGTRGRQTSETLGSGHGALTVALIATSPMEDAEVWSEGAYVPEATHGHDLEPYATRKEGGRKKGPSWPSLVSERQRMERKATDNCCAIARNQHCLGTAKGCVNFGVPKTERTRRVQFILKHPGWEPTIAIARTNRELF